MYLSDTIVRLIRTYVPIVIGGLIANIPGLAGVINTDALVMVVIAAYYSLVTVLENKVWYGFGWLLGSPKVNSKGAPVSKTF